MKNLLRAPARLATPMFVTSAMFVAAGGYIHLREWLDVYRHVPAASAGAAVVRIGFPVNAAVSLVLAVALLVCAWRLPRFSSLVVAGAAVFQLGSLAMLIATRTGTVFGWTEPGWSGAPSLTRAAAIGALISLAAIAYLAAGRGRASPNLPLAAAGSR